MENGFLVKQTKLVFVTGPANYSGTAATATYFSLKNYTKCRFLIQTGAWAGGTAAVTLAQATAVASTGTKALAIDNNMIQVWSNKAAPTTDTFVLQTVASNTFNLDTASSMWIIEVSAAQLDVANAFDCIAIAVASPSANADFYSIMAELYGARYEQGTPPTSLVD